MDTVLTSPLARARETAQPIANLQALAGYKRPEIEESRLLIDRDWGTFEGRLASEVLVRFLDPSMLICRFSFGSQKALMLAGYFQCSLLLLIPYLCYVPLVDPIVPGSKHSLQKVYAVTGQI